MEEIAREVEDDGARPLDVVGNIFFLFNMFDDLLLLGDFRSGFLFCLLVGDLRRTSHSFLWRW